MSKNSMQFVSNVSSPARGMRAADERSESVVVTGQSVKTLQLFAGIHKSKRFTVDAAHQSFAGLKRKRTKNSSDRHR